MKFQETGRFGRITKNLRKKGVENKMVEILHDSSQFPKLKKKDQTKYVETVMDRMVDSIGQKKTDEVLFSCGQQCCGKSWANFAKRIWSESDSLESFFVNLNKAEEKYSTTIQFCKDKQTIKVNRSKCICGLINKGEHFSKNKSFCNCSIGHMEHFFSSIFIVKDIDFTKSIFNGNEQCEWIIEVDLKDE